MTVDHPQSQIQGQTNISAGDNNIFVTVCIWALHPQTSQFHAKVKPWRVGTEGDLSLFPDQNEFSGTYVTTVSTTWRPNCSVKFLVKMFSVWTTLSRVAPGSQIQVRGSVFPAASWATRETWNCKATQKPPISEEGGNPESRKPRSPSSLPSRFLRLGGWGGGTLENEKNWNFRVNPMSWNVSISELPLLSGKTGRLTPKTILAPKRLVSWSPPPGLRFTDTQRNTFDCTWPGARRNVVG